MSCRLVFVSLLVLGLPLHVVGDGTTISIDDADPGPNQVADNDGIAEARPGLLQPFGLASLEQDGPELESPDEPPPELIDAGTLPVFRKGDCTAKGKCRCLNCCDQDPYRLFPCNRWGWDIRGWVAAGATLNFDNPPSNYNGVITYNDRQEGQLNQLYMIAERTPDTSCKPWDFGARVDVLYGTDARFTETDPLGSVWNSHEFYGVDLPQFYLEAAYSRLSVKLGRYYRIAGYESVMAPDNFFYSHAFGFQYGEPLTHFGALGSYCMSDNMTAYFGFDRGWDRVDPNSDSDQLSYVGGLIWDNHSGTKLAATGTTGLETANPFLPGVKDNRWFYSLVFAQELSDRLSVVLQHDLGHQQQGSPFNGESAEWYSLNAYMYYRVTCKWTVGARVEWFRDDDGARVGGLGGRNNGSPIVPFGFAGRFWGVTFGANWKPCNNVVIRPELRFDDFSGRSGFGPLPFDDGNDHNQMTAAIDAVIQF